MCGTYGMRRRYLEQFGDLYGDDFHLVTLPLLPEEARFNPHTPLAPGAAAPGAAAGRGRANANVNADADAVVDANADADANAAPDVDADADAGAAQVRGAEDLRAFSKHLVTRRAAARTPAARASRCGRSVNAGCGAALRCATQVRAGTVRERCEPPAGGGGVAARGGGDAARRQQLATSKVEACAAKCHLRILGDNAAMQCETVAVFLLPPAGGPAPSPSSCRGCVARGC